MPHLKREQAGRLIRTLGSEEGLKPGKRECQDKKLEVEKGVGGVVRGDEGVNRKDETKLQLRGKISQYCVRCTLF